MSEQAETFSQTGTPGEQREGCAGVVPTKSPTICSADVHGQAFTLVFDGDLRAFKGNPLRVETPFGEPRGACLGDAFAKQMETEDVADALAGALLDMMKVIPPNGRTREQMDAMVAAGKAVSLWRDL